ncbi:MAG: hypothetical protein J7M18_07990 [Candidatus Eremiobacteraeota bacterium]|nr:hypothetical protein [Candidatus Eremiobacteraeota bacterium]
MATESIKTNELSGLAALRLLVRHYRMEFYEDGVKEKLDNIHSDTELDGRLAEFAGDCGFNVKEYNNISLELIAEAVDKGIPPIVKGNISIARGEEGSGETGYFLVSGYQRDGHKSYCAFNIIDPVLKKKYHLPSEQFLGFWNIIYEEEDLEERENIYSMILVLPPDRELPF